MAVSHDERAIAVAFRSHNISYDIIINLKKRDEFNRTKITFPIKLISTAKIYKLGKRKFSNN